MKGYQQLTACFFLLTASFFSFGQNEFKKDSSKVKRWFPQYDFSIASFQRPPLEFAPFARWWWPGNDVTKEELRRKINLFAENHFRIAIWQTFYQYIPFTFKIISAGF